MQEKRAAGIFWPEQLVFSDEEAAQQAAARIKELFLLDAVDPTNIEQVLDALETTHAG